MAVAVGNANILPEHAVTLDGGIGLSPTRGFDADFTVSATGNKHPNISGTNALSRYWTLTAGGITANLTAIRMMMKTGR